MPLLIFDSDKWASEPERRYCAPACLTGEADVLEYRIVTFRDQQRQTLQLISCQTNFEALDQRAGSFRTRILKSGKATDWSCTLIATSGSKL